MSHQDYIYEKARKRAIERKKFRQHLMSFILVIGFLSILNQITAPEYWWVIWPALGWGLGLAFHAVKALGAPGFEDDDELVAKEYEQMMRHKSAPSALPEPEEQELEMRELKELRKEWEDDEFV